jgi:hypothetical protein
MLIDEDRYLKNFDNETTDQEVNEFLEHFGVMGMKWGIRNDRKHSRRNRAKKNDAKAADYQKQIDALKTRPSNEFTIMKIEKLNEDKKKELAIAKAKREGKLTPSQRKVSIGAAAVGTIVAAYATYKTADIGEFNRLAIKGKDWVNQVEKHSWNKDPKLATKDLTADAIKLLVVDKINPGYGEIGTKMNCRRATLAYEMRRRGNDVKATRSVGGTGQTSGGMLRATTKEKLNIPTTIPTMLGRMASETADEALGKKPRDVRLIDLVKDLDKAGNRNAISLGKKVYDIDKVTNEKSPFPRFTSEGNSESIFKALSSQPDGARGELGVTWKMGSGHSMAWEVVKGKPVIFDAQSGKMFKSDSDFAEIGATVKEAGFTRLDNIDLNDEYLMRWLKNA